MTDSPPDISLIVPARNAEGTIERAILSVLDEPHLLEVIVVNDGSTDNTAQAVYALEDPRIEVIDGPEQGIAAAINAGLSRARGQYFARCDADDWYSAGRLEWQRDWLGAHSDFTAISSGFSTVNARGTPIAELALRSPDSDVTEQLLNGEGVTSFCTWLTRTDRLRAIGGLRPWFETAEDIDLQFRLAETGRVWHRPVVGYHYVLHDSSITHQQPSVRRQFFTDIATDFALQRRQSGTDDLMRDAPPDPPTSDRWDGPARSVKEQAAQQMEGAAWALAQQGETRQALVLMLRACTTAPTNIGMWRGLVVMSLKSLTGQFRD